MADKTIVEKAAEKLGYGLAMAEDMAGSVMNTMSKALKKAPPEKAAKTMSAAGLPERAAKKAPAKKTVKQTASKKSTTKKSPAKKASKKSVKAPIKKAGGARR